MSKGGETLESYERCRSSRPRLAFWSRACRSSASMVWFQCLNYCTENGLARLAFQQDLPNHPKPRPSAPAPVQPVALQVLFFSRCRSCSISPNLVALSQSHHQSARPRCYVRPSNRSPLSANIAVRSKPRYTVHQAKREMGHHVSHRATGAGGEWTSLHARALSFQNSPLSTYFFQKPVTSKYTSALTLQLVIFLRGARGLCTRYQTIRFIKQTSGLLLSHVTSNIGFL